ncbi:MAG: vWA domain-containing protein [Candidatus Methanofastidiosia archaeon]|jgi:hypothetical protein
MRGDHFPLNGRYIIGGLLFLVLFISIIGSSIQAENKEPIIIKDNLTTVAIKDFYTDHFRLLYGEEKAFSVNNIIESSVNPLDIVLLLDVSFSMDNLPSKEKENNIEKRIEIEKRIAMRIINSSPLHTKIAIIAFGTEDAPTVDFTDKNSSTLKKEIDNLKAEGFYSKAGEKLNEAINIASQNENPCIIVLITDAIETGGGIYRFTDFIGKAKREEIPIFCGLINPDIDYTSLKKEIEETHVLHPGLFVIDGSNISQFTDHIEDVVEEYGLEDFTVQIRPSSDVEKITIDVREGNALSPQITDSTIRIARFYADTQLKLNIKSTVNVEQYSNPKSDIIPYSVLVTYNNPLINKNVTFSERKTGSVSFEFESFWEHYKTYIMVLLLVAVILAGVVFLWKYDRRQKRIMARNLVKLSQKDEKNNALYKAIDKLKRALAIYGRLGDSHRKLKGHLDYLESEMETINKKKERIVSILTGARIKLKKVIEIVKVKQYVEEFFPSFALLKDALNTKELTVSTLERKIASIELENDPAILDEYIKNLEPFANKLKSEFQAFAHAQNLYENENSQELITLSLDYKQRIEVDSLGKTFFESKEEARFLLNLWNLNNLHKKGKFNRFISSEEKEGYEQLTKLKEMYRIISQSLDTIPREASISYAELLTGKFADIKKAIDLSTVVLQDFSAKYDKTGDPSYEQMVHTCKDIQGDLCRMRDSIELVKREIDQKIEQRISNSRQELETIKEQITKGDYSEENSKILERIKSKFKDLGMDDLHKEASRVESDLNDKMAIIGFLEETMVMSIQKLCENLSIDYKNKGKEKALELCRQIINEKNRRYDIIPQYQLLIENDLEIFLDFKKLAKYTLEEKKAPSEIETKFGEKIQLPKEIRTELINALKKDRSGTHG